MPRAAKLKLLKIRGTKRKKEKNEKTEMPRAVKFKLLYIYILQKKVHVRSRCIPSCLLSPLKQPAKNVVPSKRRNPRQEQDLSRRCPCSARLQTTTKKKKEAALSAPGLLIFPRVVSIWDASLRWLLWSASQATHLSRPLSNHGSGQQF